MEVVIVDDIDEAGGIVVDAIGRLLERRPDAVLGLATGSSPLPVYDELIRRHVAGSIDLSTVRAFLLDEYLGLPDGHPESYRAFIRRVLTDQIDLDDGRLFSPKAPADGDVAAACAEYEAVIAAAGGVDLQLLGIGSDGHIGFNEPISSLGSRTRIKTLTDETKADNARFFDDDIDAVPSHVLTQGVATILDARHLVLIAGGEHKAQAIAAAVEGPVAAMVPASALQMHPHVTVIVDESAASYLAMTPYYRSTWANKPNWQGI